MPNDSMEIPATSKKSETPSVLERVITMQPNYTLEEFFKLGTSPGGQPPEPEFSEDDILWRLQPRKKNYSLEPFKNSLKKRTLLLCRKLNSLYIISGFCIDRDFVAFFDEHRSVEGRAVFQGNDFISALRCVSAHGWRSFFDCEFHFYR